MKKLLLLIPLFLLAGQVFAQTKTVSGNIVEKATRYPVIGASIVVLETKKGAVTDANGAFTLEAEIGQTLKVSYLGLISKTYKIGASSLNIVIEMESDDNTLEEVVVTGYQTERKKDLIGAVSVVKVSDALKETNANLLNLIQGRVAGVSVTTDGAPGSAATINIRGVGSLGRNNPLYVIDGVPTDNINGLSPNDIASIQILKDASSAAIYGSRAQSGVVLVTTKKGTTKNVAVTFDAFAGVKSSRNHLDMLNAAEYGQVIFQQAKNDGLPFNDLIYGNDPSGPRIPQFLDDAKTLPAGDVDYQKETYRPAANQAYNLGISKASDKSTFYFGLNYNKEDGLAVNTNYSRVNARLNSSFQVNDWITIGENLSIASYGGVNAVNLPAALYQMPIIPLRDNLGNWGGPVKNLGDRLSPVGNLYRNKDNKSKNLKTFGNVFANVKLVKGLAYNLVAGIDDTRFRQSTFNPTFIEGRFSNTIANLTEASSNAINLNISHTLNYEMTKGKHDLKALAGYEWINNKFEAYNASAQGFFVETQDYRGLSSGEAMSNAGGSRAEAGLESQFAKLDYKYNGKYLFSATVRRDGSSRFGPGNKWAIFPAGSMGWRVSEEGFFKNSSLKSKISDLKLRVSVGKNGSQDVGDYTYASSYEKVVDFSNYDVTGSNGSAATGFSTKQIGNPKIKWETSTQTNFGLDLGLLDNQLYFTADYFIKNTSDLLTPTTFPSVNGEGSAPYLNAGSVRNQGLELLVSYRNNSAKAFQYNVDLSFTTIKNRVLSVGVDGNDVIFGGVSRIIKGQSAGEFYGYVADGLFKTQAEVDAHAIQQGKGLGRIRFSDVNGDGQITPDDRTNIGSPMPKFTSGLNFNSSYKNVDFSFFFDSSFGNKIWDSNTFNYKFALFPANHGKVLLDAWSATNMDSDIPALTTRNTNDELRNSSFYLGDGTYLRLKSISLGYTLPKALGSKLGLSKARIFVQAQNILNLTKFEGYDYEVVNSSNTVLDRGVLGEATYPHSKSISFGLNLGL